MLYSLPLATHKILNIVLFPCPFCFLRLLSKSHLYRMEEGHIVLGRKRLPVLIFKTICDTPPKTLPVLWDTFSSSICLFSL